MHHQSHQKGREDCRSQQSHIHQDHHHARLGFVPRQVSRRRRRRQPRNPVLYHSMPSGSSVQQARPPRPLHHQTMAHPPLLSAASGNQLIPYQQPANLCQPNQRREEQFHFSASNEWHDDVVVDSWQADDQEAAHSHLRQPTEPDIRRFGERMPTSDRAKTHNSDDWSSRSNKENWPGESGGEQVNRKEKHSTYNQARDRKNKDDVDKTSSSRSNKHPTNDRNAQKNLSTKVKPEKDIGKARSFSPAKRSRTSDQPITSRHSDGFRKASGPSSRKGEKDSKNSDRRGRQEEIGPKMMKIEYSRSSKSGLKAAVSSSQPSELPACKSELYEAISRESTPYSPSGCLPGEGEEAENEFCQDLVVDEWSALTTPLSPEEVSLLEGDDLPAEVGGSSVLQVAEASSSMEYDKVDLGAPLSPDVDKSVLYSPSTAPILLGHPDSPDPPQTEDVEDELTAAVQPASPEESLQGSPEKLEEEQGDLSLLDNNAEVAPNERSDVLSVQSESDVELDELSEVESDQVQEVSDVDEEDFELPFFPFDVTLHAKDDGSEERVMFESEDVLRARAVAAFGPLVSSYIETDDCLQPSTNAVKDVLRVQMEGDAYGEKGGSAVVSFNFGSLLPPTTRSPPAEIKRESPVVVVARSPSPCREATSNNATPITSTKTSCMVSPSENRSGIAFVGDGKASESPQQAFFRRLTNGTKDTTQIGFEAHRKAKFGPVEKIPGKRQNDSASSDVVFGGPLTKFNTGDNLPHASVRNKRGQLEIPMPTPPSTRQSRKKLSSRKKRKLGPVDNVSKSSSQHKTSGTVLPERRTIPRLQTLADNHSSTAHRDACRQLETLECSLEEAYWNDMEVMDEIQELESELKVAHRKKTKSHHQISALHQLVEKAAYIIDPVNAEDIMDLANHSPSEDTSRSSSRTASPDDSSPPRKRPKLSCPTYLRLPSWTAGTKVTQSKGTLDVHQDPFLTIIRNLKKIGDEEMKEAPMVNTGTATEVETLEACPGNLRLWTKPEEYASLRILLQSTALFQLRAGFAGLWSDDPRGLAYVNSVVPTKTYCFCDCPTNCPRSAKFHLREFRQSEISTKLKEQFACLSHWMAGENVSLPPEIAAILTEVQQCQSRERAGQLWLEILSHVSGSFFGLSSDDLLTE